MKCSGKYQVTVAPMSVRNLSCSKQVGCGKPGCIVNSGSLLNVMSDVKRFKEAHGQKLPDGVTTPEPERLELLTKLIREEYEEVVEAIEEGSGHAALAKELADLIYVAVGMAVEFGYPLDKVWDVVHTSNMSKIGPDGKFVVRESDGKILKGPNYVAPDVEGCLKDG